MSTPRRAAFAFVFATVAIDLLALGVMIPVLPKLILQFEGGDTQKAAWWTGAFGFAWAAMQFVASPLLGALSDRFGRRPVILLSNLGLGLDYLLMALAPSVTWLLVGRMISGATSASFGTASAYIADVTPPEQRAARFGMLGAAFGLGFVVGPAVGGMLGAVDLRLPFWGAGALTLVNFLYGVLVLPESLPVEKRAPFTLAGANPLASLRLLRSPALLGLSIACAFMYLAHEALPHTYVLYTHHRYAMDTTMVGWTLAAVGVSSTIVQAALVGPVVARLGARPTLLLGLAFGVVGMALMGLAPTTGWFFAAIGVQALWGLGGPPLQALLANTVDAAQQGKLQGALASLRGVTGMIGPVLMTSVFAWGIGADVPGASFLLSAALLVGALTASTIAGRRAA
jgi:MFS transporter, DHA1 family, tetracycline resistance protein